MAMVRSMRPPPGFVRPDCFDSWNSRLFQLLPDRGGTENTAVVSVVIRRNRGKIPQNNRVIAVANRINFNDRSRPTTARVIPQPFPKRALFPRYFPTDSTFDNKFSGGLNRQT